MAEPPPPVSVALATSLTNSLRWAPPYTQAELPAQYLETARNKLRDFGRHLQTALEKPSPSIAYAQRIIRAAAGDIEATKLCSSVRLRLTQYNANTTAMERLKAHYRNKTKQLRISEEKFQDTRNKASRKMQRLKAKHARQVSNLQHELDDCGDALLSLAAAFEEYSRQFGPGISLSFHPSYGGGEDTEMGEEMVASVSNAASESEASSSDNTPMSDSDAATESDGFFQGIVRQKVPAVHNKTWLKSAQEAARVTRVSPRPVLRVQRGALMFCLDGSSEAAKVEVDVPRQPRRQTHKRPSPTKDIWLVLAEEERDQCEHSDPPLVPAGLDSRPALATW